jgi:hypothetical protein
VVNKPEHVGGDWFAASGANRLVGCRGALFGLPHGYRPGPSDAKGDPQAPAMQQNRSHPERPSSSVTQAIHVYN